MLTIRLAIAVSVIVLLAPEVEGQSANSEFKRGQVRANGLLFHYLEAGTGPLVLALHGFPDQPGTFRHQMLALAAAGYRVVAPYMRGYAPTDAPTDTSYEQAALGQDALALIAALGQERAVLLGHDWGAAAAYRAALAAPEKVSRLITMAVPYRARQPFVENLEQQRRSWYMFFFQMPFAEDAVAYNNFAFIERLWQEWSPGWKYSSDELEAVNAVFRQPGVVRAALNYYRHAFFPPEGVAPELIASRKQSGQPIQVPALYIHGARDGCQGVELTEGMEALFPKGLQKVVIPEAGHFAHREKPEEVTGLILNFLGRP